jgi:hypothetical protein
MLQLIAHDGFFSHASRPIEITLPDRPAEIAILHPRAGSPYVAGQTIRLWGSAVAADGGPVLTDRCSWSVDGKKAGKGLDLFIAAPRAGQHEIRFTVDSVVSSVTIECVERATQAGTKLM